MDRLKREDCSAVGATTGKPCGFKELLPGTGTCFRHGASKDSVVLKAYRRGALAEVVRAVEDDNSRAGEVVVFQANPFTVLQETLTKVNDFQRLVESKLNSMADAQEAWRFTDRAGTEQLRSEVGLYERALDRAVRAAVALSKLNIEERYAALSEKQASTILYVLNQTFLRMGLTEEDRDRARIIAAQILEEILTEPRHQRKV